VDLNHHFSHNPDTTMDEASHQKVPGNYPDSAPCPSNSAATSDCCASKVLTTPNTTQASTTPTSPDNSCSSGQLMEDNSCLSGEFTEQNHLSGELTEEHWEHNDENSVQDLSIAKNNETLHSMSNALSWFVSKLYYK
jgi:hypothetical protein